MCAKRFGHGADKAENEQPRKRTLTVRRQTDREPTIVERPQSEKAEKIAKPRMTVVRREDKVKEPQRAPRREEQGKEEEDEDYVDQPAWRPATEGGAEYVSRNFNLKFLDVRYLPEKAKVSKENLEDFKAEVRKRRDEGYFEKAENRHKQPWEVPYPREPESDVWSQLAMWPTPEEGRMVLRSRRS